MSPIPLKRCFIFRKPILFQFKLESLNSIKELQLKIMNKNSHIEFKNYYIEFNNHYIEFSYSHIEFNSRYHKITIIILF